MSAGAGPQWSPRGFARGDFLPSFVAESNVNRTYAFDTVAGHRLLIAFVGSGGNPLGAEMCETLITLVPLLKAHDIRGFVVTADPSDRDSDLFRRVAEHFITFWDIDKRIHNLYGMTATGAMEAPDQPVPMLRLGAFLVRENLRLEAYLGAGPLETFPTRLSTECAAFGPRGPFEAVEVQAPVLIVPEVFDRGLCDRLISYYEARGGSVSGFMREIDGMTRALLDTSIKRRMDVTIKDEGTLDSIRRGLSRRLVTEIRKAFNFNPDRIERYIVACYDSGDRGFFKAHRDNTSRATAHRRFAVTINLNAEGYDGGEVWFPEYGRRLYRPPTGGAVVFSCALLHEARPVTRGKRYAFLPFLYDGAAAKIREQNRRYLSDRPPTPVDALRQETTTIAQHPPPLTP